MDFNEVTRVDKDDFPGNLNIGAKQNNIGIEEINKHNNEAGTLGKPMVLQQQEKKHAPSGVTTKKQRNKLHKARNKQQISSAKLEFVIARQKTENTCETTSEMASQERERIKSFPILQRHKKKNEDNTGKIVDVKATRGTGLAKNTMKPEQSLITIPSRNRDDIISELTPQKQQLIEAPKIMGTTGKKRNRLPTSEDKQRENNKEWNMQTSGTNDYALKVQSIIGKDMMCRLPDYEEE
ncbi:hypothetical protein NDU88_008314 [Pleurodeles waltl]|uniref:Uncharacterized protein n=1 Tax=Pleurodeles waltl TaxID=8319 RepID=A0AAV7VV51_PLEWA|nr:hypothetical protein NDU88_008314 [Pleurodeles waltl]